MSTIPPAVELRQIDLALARIEADRMRLLARRAQLIAQLQSAPAQAPAWGAPAWGAPAGGAPAWGAPPAAKKRETSPPTVQNVLLALGGMLLTVAVIAFTVVSWGHLGLAGRSAILAVLTAAALGTPVVLLRRSLVATAEVVACLGLVLLFLDAYALRRGALPDVDSDVYGAATCTAVTVVWAAYGLWTRRSSGAEGDGAGRSGAAARSGLRLPLPVAVFLGQTPILLWATAASVGPFGIAVALTATAALDLLVAARRLAPGARTIALIGAGITGGCGLIIAFGLSVTPADAAHALRVGLLLGVTAAAALALAARPAAGAAPAAPSATPSAPPGFGPAPTVGTLPPALRDPRLWWAVLGAACLVAGVGGMLRVGLPAQGTVVGHLLCGTALLVAARAVAGRAPLAGGLAWTSAAVHGYVLLWALPGTAGALFGPLSWVGSVWSGAPSGAREAIGPDLTWPGTVAVPVVLAIAAADALAMHRYGPTGRLRATAGQTAFVLACATAVVLPVTLDLAHPVALLLLVAEVGVLLTAAATLTPPLSHTALGCAGAVAVSAACWSLAEQTTTLTVLAALLIAFAASAVSPGGRIHQPVTVCAALACATGLAVAVPASLDQPAHRSAFAVLAVAVAASLVAHRLRERPAVLPLECGGYVVAATSVAMTVDDAIALASVLALAGVLLAGTALRPGRLWARYASGVLFVAATWVRLSAADVDVPEAYTLPVTAAALAVGLTGRRSGRTSSWAVYGPGLSATLLPSLVATWSDAHWLRALLLGTAALGLTLAGARWRLQAPLLLGGGVLALVALHELTPYIVQAVGALPRWLPPALVGLLLLVLGATYEQRLRDARRIREALGRLG